MNQRSDMIATDLYAVPLIRVNGRVIEEEEIAREVQYHPAETLQVAQQQAARALVIRELLLAEANKQGIALDRLDVGETDEEARIRGLLAANVAVPEPSEADCRRYYASNGSKMRTADQHEVSHILFPAPPDDAELRARARGAAMQVTEQLQAEPKRFAALAREHSSCPSQEVGGHLGLIARGQTAPEFERALSRLPVGEVPAYPVETRFGFHVVLIHQRQEGKPLTFEACQERIAEYLREHVRRRAISQFIRVLAADHEVEGIDLDAASSPLVQ